MYTIHGWYGICISFDFPNIEIALLSMIPWSFVLRIGMFNIEGVDPDPQFWSMARFYGAGFSGKNLQPDPVDIFPLQEWSY